MNTATNRITPMGDSQFAPAQALAAIANRPMMMAPGALEAMKALAMSVPARKGARDDSDWALPGSKPEDLISISNGVGVVAVRGPLFQRWDIATWWWGGTGYDMIVGACRKLEANAGVREIVLDLDSSGGQCAGCWDAVDDMLAVGKKKPITAVINDAGFSACYALATSAKRIVITRTGGAGSIGVRATHVDISKWNERAGVAYTDVVSGEKKGDYSPNAPMSDRALAELQTEVNRLAEIFFGYAATSRRKKVAEIRAMQAGLYFGPGAVSAGLCDEVGTLDSVLKGLASGSSAAAGKSDPKASAELAQRLDTTAVYRHINTRN